MEKDYKKVMKQVQKVLDESLKIIPIIEKSKHGKEILDKLDGHPFMKDFVMKLQYEIAKLDALKLKLNKQK